MLDYPMVSAIITTCRRPNLVGRAIDSVFAQGYPAMECLVVNDDVDLETRAVLAAKRLQYPSLRIIQHEGRRGLSQARNSGMEAAIGEFVAFLDDDDVWLPEKTSRQVKKMLEAEPKVDLVYCWFDLRRGSEVTGGRRTTLEGKIFGDLIVSQPLGNGSTYLVRRDPALAIGGFDVSLERGIDGDFVRRLAVNSYISYVPDTLVHLFVGHEYERITTDDDVGLRRALRSHEIKLEKFPELSRTHPKQASELYAVIANHHALLHDTKSALKSLARGLALRPLSALMWRHVAKVGRTILTRSIVTQQEKRRG